MSSQLSPDQLSKLQPALAGAARLIARGAAIGTAQIPLLLQADDLEPTAAHIEEIERAARILRTVAVNLDEATREVAVESLMMRGWLEAPARSAVNAVAAAQPAENAIAPVVLSTSLRVSPERLEWTLPAGQSAHAEILVEGGLGTATSDSDQVTVAPSQFGPEPTCIGVSVRQLGSTPLLWANLTLATPQDTRVVPIVAQWQDAPMAAGVAPVQTHQATSSASGPLAAQTRIAREMAASPAAQTSAMASTSSVLKRARGLALPVAIVVFVLAVALLGLRYVRQATAPAVAQSSTGGVAVAGPAATDTATFSPNPAAVAATVQPTKTPTSTAEPTFTSSPTASPSAAPTSTATAEPTAIPPDTPTATPPPLPGFTVKEGSAVNVRSGPGTNYDVIGQLPAGPQRTVTGRTAASDWWQFDFNGRMGWVSNSVVIAFGFTDSVSIVSPPPVPTAQADLGLSLNSQPVVLRPPHEDALGTPAFEVAFSPDGKILATGHYGGLRLWRVLDRSLLRTLTWSGGGITAIQFSPDSQMVITGDAGGELRFWRVSDGLLLRTVAAHDNSQVSDVRISPDGQLVASGGLTDDSVRLWKTSDGNLVRILQGSNEADSWKLAFSPDGSTLAAGGLVGGLGRTIRFWQVSDGTLTRRLDADRGYGPQSLQFSPDGALLAVDGEGYTIGLWRVSDGALVRSLVGHDGGVRSIAFSRDGKRLVSGSWDKTIRFWRVADGTLLRTINAGGDISSVALSPDGRLLAAGTLDNADWAAMLWQ